MSIKLKGEFLGAVSATKKGAFVRQMLYAGADGSKNVVTVFSADRSKLEQSGIVEVVVRPGDMVFAA